MPWIRTTAGFPLFPKTRYSICSILSGEAKVLVAPAKRNPIVTQNLVNLEVEVRLLRDSLTRINSYRPLLSVVELVWMTLHSRLNEVRESGKSRAIIICENSIQHVGPRW